MVATICKHRNKHWQTHTDAHARRNRLAQSKSNTQEKRNRQEQTRVKDKTRTILDQDNPPNTSSHSMGRFIL